MRLSGPALRLAGGGVPRPALCQCQVAPGTKGRKPGTLAILRHLRIEPTPVGLSCLSWKWRKRSSVKITERTHEETTEALHAGREGRHSEEAFGGRSADLGPV